MSDRNMRKTDVGKVVSDKMDKTVVVAIENRVKHKLYNKIIKRTIKLKVQTRITSAKSATEYALWRPVLFPRIRDGDSSRLLKELNKLFSGFEKRRNAL